LKDRNRDWQDPYIERAFKAAKSEDVPPVILDALTRMCAKIQAQITEENIRAPQAPGRSRGKAPKKGTKDKEKKKGTNGDGKIAGTVGVGVGMVKETIDYIFKMAWGGERSIMEFFELPLIDGGIVGLLTFVGTFFARRKK